MNFWPVIDNNFIHLLHAFFTIRTNILLVHRKKLLTSLASGQHQLYRSFFQHHIDPFGKQRSPGFHIPKVHAFR